MMPVSVLILTTNWYLVSISRQFSVNMHASRGTLVAALAEAAFLQKLSYYLDNPLVARGAWLPDSGLDPIPVHIHYSPLSIDSRCHVLVSVKEYRVDIIVTGTVYWCSQSERLLSGYV